MSTLDRVGFSEMVVRFDAEEAKSIPEKSIPDKSQQKARATIDPDEWLASMLRYDMPFPKPSWRSSVEVHW